MRVLISVINYKFLTGAEMYVYELSRQLKKVGHEVLITSRVVGGEITEKSRALGIEVYDFESCPSNWNPDVLHLNELSPAGFALSLYPTVPAVTSVHSQYAVELPFISNRIAKYICIRPEVQAVVVNQYNIPSEKTVVIYNGVDFERFKNFGPIPKKRKTLFVGTIDPLRRQSMEHLIKQAKKNHSEVQIVGEKHGTYLDALPSHVKLAASTWSVENYLKDATETAGILLGRTTIEGWAAGRPGWIYDVDLEGNIKSVDLHQPPRDLDDRFNIVNVVKKIENEYVSAIKEYKYDQATSIAESLRATSLALGMAAAHDYHLHGFNAIQGRNDATFSANAKNISQMQNELHQLRLSNADLNERIERLYMLLPLRIYRKLSRIVK